MHEAGKFGPRNTRKATKGAKCFRVFRALSRRSCSKPPWTTLQVQVDELTSCRIPLTPPNFQPLASLLDAHSSEVQEVFQFLPATAMHEAGKFGPRNTRKATKGAKCFRGLCFLHALHDHSPDAKTLA
jgi:ribosomal protein L37AE/L43A